MRLKTEDIARICAGTVLDGPLDADISSICWDSRTAQPGCMYIAFVGEVQDGHNFCLEAVRSGARAVLISRTPGVQTQLALDKAGACTILVDDTLEAMTQLARAWRQELRGKVIALTGSSGKTTTKNMVRDVLAHAGTVVATVANQNNELGVPATLLAAELDTDFVVVEMGMRGLGQLAELCEFVLPDAALVTNVGTSHMELLGSQDAIARAKAEPFSYLVEGQGTAFVNASDPFAEKLLEYGTIEQRCISLVAFDGSGDDEPHTLLGKPASVYASNVSYDALGMPSFTLHTPKGSAECVLQIAGAHNVHNALAAAALGVWAGLDAQTIAEALHGSAPAAGRQQLRRATSGALIVDDSYNANPDSMAASLETFARMDVAGSRIAVLGDMLELGDYEDEGHARIGSLAAQSGLDLLMCVGPRSERIAQAAKQAGMSEDSIICVDDAEAALACLVPMLHANDALLVKASHSVGLETIVKGLVDKLV